MGCGPAAGVAQITQDFFTVHRARLRVRLRIISGKLWPCRLPAWGSIIGDVRFVELVRPLRQRLRGPAMAARVTQAWKRRAVQENVKKREDGVAGGEVQRAQMHPDRHTLGLAPKEALGLFTVGVWLLCFPAPSRITVERLEGKLGHQGSRRPTVRSALAWTDIRLRDGRDRGLARFRPDRGGWLETSVTVLFGLFCYIDMKAPFCTRVEASDAMRLAARARWGQTYTRMRPDMVHRLCQAAGIRGAPASLQQADGLLLPPWQPRHFSKVRIPMS